MTYSKITEEGKVNQGSNQIFKDKYGKELHVGDKVKYYTYPNYDKYFPAVIEKFATTTVRVLLNGKTPKYTQSRYLELYADDVVETIYIDRKTLKNLLELLKGKRGYNKLVKNITKILKEGE